MNKVKLANRISQKRLVNLENSLRIDIGRFFLDMNIKVLQELKEYWSDTQLLKGQVNLILAPVHEMHEEYNKLLFTYRQKVFTIGYNQGSRLVKARQGRQALKSNGKKTIKLHNEQSDVFGTLSDVEQTLRDDTFNASEITLSRVDQSITELLEQGYRDGVGIDQVAKDIKGRFDQLRSWEAKRIARTEIHTAHSMGRNQSYQDLGVNYTEWISAHDKRVRGNRKGDRANHIIMDGEIKPINATYSNGLKYPGDKTGKIEEWINCRCSEAPFIMPPGKSAPPGLTNFKVKDLVSVPEANYDELLSEATSGALNWETYRKSIYDKTILDGGREKMILQQQKSNTDEINVQGLETIDTFKETIKAENKKLYQACKRHDCFEEAYSILKNSKVTEFNIKEVKLIDISKMKKEELKEYIQYTNQELFWEVYDKSWQKFCEAFDLVYEFANGRVIIDEWKVTEAVCHGINEMGESLCYPMESKSKNKKGGQTLMLAIDF